MSDVFSDFYSSKLIKYVNNPKNMGLIKNPDGESTVGNPVCGDIMKYYIKIEKKGKVDYIKDIKFQTLGCGAAIATSSILTVMVKGKKVSDALKISKKAIAKALGGLPSIKMHCSVLAEEALKKAVANYRNILRK
jgi:nitrogen fixation NifU-like protein